MIEIKKYKLRPLEELDPFKDQEKLYSWFMQLDSIRKSNAQRLENEGYLKLITNKRDGEIYLTSIGTVIEIISNIEAELYGNREQFEETTPLLEKLVEGSSTEIMEIII